VSTELKAASVIVNIQDEGAGISPGDQRRIFDRFFRASDISLNQPMGMGLGLYITSQIIERHGGIINVNSEPGKGSLFSFTLPLQNA
jgi:signal transduction histidine kinase